NPGKILVPATFSATLEWVEGGTVAESPVRAEGESQWAQAAADAQAAQSGAAMTAVARTSDTEGTLRAVMGGTPMTRTVTAGTVDALETAITEVKTEVGQ